MYKVLASVNAVENREILLLNDFQPDVDGILAQADDKSKLLFLCSPNNPTANSFAREKVEMLLQSFPGLVVIDEAYIDFSEGSGWLDQLDSWPGLIVTQTLSKAYGMAGIRLGICYASSAIIKVLNKIKPPYNINELTQRQAFKSLNDREALEKAVLTIQSEKRKLEAQFRNLPCIKQLFPSDANFILARVDDAALRYSQLLEKGIVVRNRSGQPLCENTLRFTVGSPDENKKLTETLKLL